ncbi:MAG: hypothetical protein ACOY3P_14070 [Planctomycetota bacterium]
MQRHTFSLGSIFLLMTLWAVLLSGVGAVVQEWNRPPRLGMSGDERQSVAQGAAAAGTLLGLVVGASVGTGYRRRLQTMAYCGLVSAIVGATAGVLLVFAPTALAAFGAGSVLLLGVAALMRWLSKPVED